MAQMYYAKISFNSDIYKTKQYGGEVNLNDVLDKLYLSINDKEEFVKEKNYYKDDKEKINKEIFNFSELTKIKTDKEYYISGNIVRRFPYFTERWDDKNRKSNKDVISNNSSSIFFYMDVRNEIVTFCSRKNFGHVQFIEAFKNLMNQCCKEYGFDFILINDPFTMKQRLKKADKIYFIKSTVIPPNINEEHLKKLYDGELKSLKAGNIGRKVSIFEQDKKNSEGINQDSHIVKGIIDSTQAFKNYERGYAKLEVEGKYSDGSSFKFSSDEDSPYITVIEDEDKEYTTNFIEASKRGIDIYIVNISK